MTNLADLFKNKELLDQALTHRSWVNEHKNLRRSNERLEFLGDAVLEFVVSSEIYKAYAGQAEGYLTALRANLVNTVSLAQIAKDLDLGKMIHLSKGEQDSGGRENSSLLADTVEAIIGALFIDQGLPKASEFIYNNLLKDLEKRAKLPLKDSKSLLQEYVQSQGLPTPKYKVISEIGPDHNKAYTVGVFYGDKLLARGVGKSKQEAEKKSAQNAMDKLELV